MSGLSFTRHQQKLRMLRDRGFTLIELMIVVVIVAILASIAYPSYRNQVVKGNRAAAQGYMMSLSSREEQIMLDNRSYKAATTAQLADANGPLRFAPPVEVSKFYDLSIAAPIAVVPPTYMITATPKAGGMQATDGILTLDNTGKRLPAGKW